MSADKLKNPAAVEIQSAFRRRAEAFRRYAEWEAKHIETYQPADAVAGVGWLYELLPVECRQWPIDTRGIAKLHRCLALHCFPTAAE
jgi:hypothetical protein